MKATGIVRRIDDLGRVVIPKEIRRTMRIREGDPLEIFTGSNNEVVFKKYSPIGEITEFAAQYADVMSRACGLPVVIGDRDHVIAVSGESKKEFMERRLSPELEKVMDERQLVTARTEGGKGVPVVEGRDRLAGIAAPILSSGDVTGCVCILMNEAGAMPGDTDIKLAQVAAAFLGKQMEE